jgi:hypothetical protein
VEDKATVLEDAELTSIDVITNDINVDENTFPAYNGNVFITELADPNGLMLLEVVILDAT